VTREEATHAYVPCQLTRYHPKPSKYPERPGACMRKRSAASRVLARIVATILFDAPGPERKMLLELPLQIRILDANVVG